MARDAAVSVARVAAGEHGRIVDRGGTEFEAVAERRGLGTTPLAGWNSRPHVSEGAYLLCTRMKVNSIGSLRSVSNDEQRRVVQATLLGYTRFSTTRSVYETRRYTLRWMCYHQSMSTTRTHRHINAPRAVVYRTLLDARAIPRWKVPEGMTCQVHTFDAREGGAIRISLTYDEPTGTGKTASHMDTYYGRFVTSCRTSGSSRWTSSRRLIPRYAAR